MWAQGKTFFCQLWPWIALSCYGTWSAAFSIAFSWMTEKDQMNGGHGGHGVSCQENTVTCNEIGLTSAGHVARSSSEARETNGNRSECDAIRFWDKDLTWFDMIWHDSLFCKSLWGVCVYIYIHIIIHHIHLHISSYIIYHIYIGCV